MRVVVLSYSHHGRGIGRVVRDLGHEIVGVMDGEEGARRTLAAVLRRRLSMRCAYLRSRMLSTIALGQIAGLTGLIRWARRRCGPSWAGVIKEILWLYRII